MPVIASYTKLEDAHLAVSKLEGSGIRAWLRDEATANIYWFYSNAIGGVKVEVAEQDLERAIEILDLPKESGGCMRCPNCGSEHVRLLDMSLFSALVLIFLNWIFRAGKPRAYCLDCKTDFKPVYETSEQR